LEVKKDPKEAIQPSQIIPTNGTNILAPNPKDLSPKNRKQSGPCGSSTTENRRCCRKPVRLVCPNGRKPQIVQRQYRNVNSPECISYSYGYCGLVIELVDNPMKFEQDCYELCYSQLEKDTLPLFKNIQFTNGFRTDNPIEDYFYNWY
jgi:hypothetical protein